MTVRPSNIGQLIKLGGVETVVLAAGKEAMQAEREFWLEKLKSLEADAVANGDPDDDKGLVFVRKEIRGLRRKLGLFRTAEELMKMNRARVRKYQLKKQAETTPTGLTGEAESVEGDMAGAGEDNASVTV